VTECQSKQSCLHTYNDFLSKDPKDSRYRDHPCCGCVIGLARKTEDFVPPPGIGPCCIQCGYELSHSRTGLCMECSRRGNRNTGNKTKHSHAAYWGYREVSA
jgi:hypothetical protein